MDGRNQNQGSSYLFPCQFSSYRRGQAGLYGEMSREEEFMLFEMNSLNVRRLKCSQIEEAFNHELIMLQNRPKLPTLAERYSVPSDSLNLSFEHSADRLINEISQVSLESCLKELKLIDDLESLPWKLFFKNLNFS